MLVQLQLRAPKVPVQEGAGALEAPAVLVQGVHSASWCTVLCGAGHMCGRGAPARCTHVARRARSTLSHIYSCVTVRDGLKSSQSDLHIERGFSIRSFLAFMRIPSSGK